MPALGRQEWLKWFTATAGVLNADEFELVMTEMTAAADNMVAPSGARGWRPRLKEPVSVGDGRRRRSGASGSR